MARKQVIQIQCERCDRIETLDPDKQKPKSGAVLELNFDGEKSRFEDLCSPCYKAVKAHIAVVTKKIKGLSPERKIKGMPDEVAVIIEEEEEARATKKGQKPPPPPTHVGQRS